jgi:GLPGLI family protein
MYKKIFLITLFANFFTFAQQQNNKGLVYYGQIESSFIGKGRKGTERLACLVFDKNNSSYVSQKDSLDAILNTFPDRNGGTTIYTGGLPATKNGSQVYTSISKDSVWSSFLNDGLQYVAEKKYQFNWNLQKETKKIGRFTCNKATTHFRGRDYTAWYTTEIPLPYGPWKLQGLPGLILEAYDTSEDIYYYFKSIEYPTTNKTPIDFIKKPTNGRPIQWMDRAGYMKFCDDFLQSMYERMIMVSKELPNIEAVFEKATIEESFKEITE